MSGIIQTIVGDYFTPVVTGPVGSLPSTLATSTSANVYPTTNTWNPTGKASSLTLSDGNLAASGINTTQSVIAINGASTGYYYWEVIPTVSPYVMIGIAQTTLVTNENIYSSQGANVAITAYGGGGIYNGSTNISPTTGSAPTFVVGQTISICLNLTTNVIGWYVNGVFACTVSFPSGKTWYPAGGMGSSTNWTQTANFGNTQFVYAPPAGYTGAI